MQTSDTHKGIENRHKAPMQIKAFFASILLIQVLTSKDILALLLA